MSISVTGTHLPVPAALVCCLQQDGGLRRLLLKEGGVGLPPLSGYRRAAPREAEAGSGEAAQHAQITFAKGNGRNGWISRARKDQKGTVAAGRGRALCTRPPYRSSIAGNNSRDTAQNRRISKHTPPPSKKKKKAYFRPSKRLLQHLKPKKQKAQARSSSSLMPCTPTNLSSGGHM